MHVVPKVENLRTRVQFPPPPPNKNSIWDIRSIFPPYPSVLKLPAFKIKITMAFIKSYSLCCWKM